jgi:hypothetical protein
MVLKFWDWWWWGWRRRTGGGEKRGAFDLVERATVLGLTGRVKLKLKWK